MTAMATGLAGPVGGYSTAVTSAQIANKILSTPKAQRLAAALAQGGIGAGAEQTARAALMRLINAESAEPTDDEPGLEDDS